MALTKIDDRGLKTPIDLLDNEKIRLGTGNDLEIYHDSSHSYIKETGTGQLKLQSSHLSLQSTTGEEMLVANPDGAVELYFDNSKKFSTINAGAYVTGSFGVGATTNPSHLYNQGIHIHAAGTGAVLHLTDTTTGSAAGDGFDVLTTSGEAFLWQRENSNMRFGTNATECMRLDSAGRLQVNQTTNIIGTAKLEVMGTSDSSYPQYSAAIGIADTNAYDTANGAGNGIGFAYKYNNGGSYAFGPNIRGFKENTTDGDYAGALAFYTRPNGGAGAERMRIDSAGRMLIGTTTTTGISAGSDDIVIGSIGDSTYRGLTFATTTEAAIRWADAGDNAMGRIEYSNSADTMTFNTSNATRMRLDSDGMKFGTDTAAANALHDYEEGTWTPAVYGGIDGGAQYQNQRGWYTKIGRFVQVSFYFQFVNNATGSTGNGNQAVISGLPFNSANLSPSYNSGGMITYTSMSMSGDTQLSTYIDNNDSKIYLYRNRMYSAAWTTGAGDNSNKGMYGYVTYVTNT